MPSTLGEGWQKVDISEPSFTTKAAETTTRAPAARNLSTDERAWSYLGFATSLQASGPVRYLQSQNRAPPNCMVWFRKTPVLPNLDFREVLKSGRLFGTCPFSRQHLSRRARIAPLFPSRIVSIAFLSFPTITYPPMSANQENITPFHFPGN